MSAEAFDTPLTADLATAPDGRGVLVAAPGSREPRAFGGARRSDQPRWATCYLNAEMAVRVAAESVRLQQMDGLSGDHPEERQLAARLLHATADLVRDLALDHACDGAFDEEQWALRLGAIKHLLSGGSYLAEDLRTRSSSVLLVSCDT